MKMLRAWARAAAALAAGLGALLRASPIHERDALAAAPGGAAPTTSAGATPTASASASSAAQDAPKSSLAAYAWPSGPSPEPKPEEWEHATALETVTLDTRRESWLPRVHITCSPSLVREWLRVTCDPGPSWYFGIVWGMAGDLSTAKGAIAIAPGAPPKTRADDDHILDMTRKMGVSTTLIVALRPGASSVISIDRMAWEEEYEGQSVNMHPGVLLDISWALGEKSPTIAYR